ncbi:Nucleolar protein 4 [Papilio xuthus]|uniref:Nucleolar protein 4 n=1 Tax=Papilio xuthus TaxID=66420 RepID=A0A194Q6S0_PAPXU|nr:Nucleolar protein 4 [Papilio xuthus]
MVVVGSWHGSVEWCGGAATSASLAPHPPPRPPPATRQSTATRHAPHGLHHPLNPPQPDTGLYTDTGYVAICCGCRGHGRVIAEAIRQPSRCARPGPPQDAPGRPETLWDAPWTPGCCRPDRMSALSRITICVDTAISSCSHRSNAPSQEPVYRKVAIVENFFDIIYTVHVELEGRPGKHAGQKRTYRTITETYAFLPREAVTRFLTGCAECARRPRSASPPPLPTPSPSPTRHPPYLPFLPHCAADYTRNWESEIDAAHSNYPYEPKFDYTELQPLKKVESPKPTDTEDEPTYIELTSKKVNGFDSTPIINRSSSVEPAFREEQPVRTDPEIDKDENSLIDVEDVKVDDSPPPVVLEEKQEVEEEKVNEESDKESTRATENIEVTEPKVEVKKEKKYNPLDVANLTSKDPPKSRSPPRKKLLPTSIDCSNSFGRYPRPWRPDGGLYYAGEDVDYSVPITTAYLKHMRSMAYQDSLDGESKERRIYKRYHLTCNLVMAAIDSDECPTPKDQNVTP